MTQNVTFVKLGGCMDKTEFTSGKEYLLLLYHTENGVVDVE